MRPPSVCSPSRWLTVNRKSMFLLLTEPESLFPFCSDRYNVPLRIVSRSTLSQRSGGTRAVLVAPVLVGVIKPSCRVLSQRNPVLLKHRASPVSHIRCLMYDTASGLRASCFPCSDVLTFPTVHLCYYLGSHSHLRYTEATTPNLKGSRQRQNSFLERERRM